MKHTLNYGRISWAYEDFDPEFPCRPSPFLKFSSIRINGKTKVPQFGDKTSLILLKHTTPEQDHFRTLFKRWYLESSWIDRDLGEGRAFLRWLQKHNLSVAWEKTDFNLHQYFIQQDAPMHDPQDEMARGLSFAICPVQVGERKIKLYVKDEDILNLINMPYGEDEDFLKLIKDYITMRFKWEKWRAPSPTFLDWIKAQAKRPLFSKGQLGFSMTP